jgi:hypothetical protein
MAAKKAADEAAVDAPAAEEASEAAIDAPAAEEAPEVDASTES